MPSVAVYGIYKNEEKFIERFLNSVKEADEIVLCDTGSTDNTNEKIQRFQQNNPEINFKIYKIHVSPWRFDDARNVALSLVDKNIDLCISLDIDEYFMDNWKEILIAKWDDKFTRVYHKFKTIWSETSFSAHWHDRIHIRHGYRWSLPVHEILEYKSKEEICWLNDFWIYHQPDSQKSRTSYLSLLEQSVQERPDIWKSWSFLAGEYLALKKFEECKNAINQAFQLKESDKGFLARSLYHLYRSQNKPEQALISLNNYIYYSPNRREPYFEKAIYLHSLGRNKEAYFCLQEAKQQNNKAIDYHYNPYSWGESFNKIMLKIAELAEKEEGVE